MLHQYLWLQLARVHVVMTGIAATELLAVAAVFGFATLDPEKAREIENQYQAGQLEREVQAELKTAARPDAPAGIESTSQGVTR